MPVESYEKIKSHFCEKSQKYLKKICPARIFTQKLAVLIFNLCVLQISWLEDNRLTDRQAEQVNWDWLEHVKFFKKIDINQIIPYYSTKTNILCFTVFNENETGQTTGDSLQYNKR